MTNSKPKKKLLAGFCGSFIALVYVAVTSMTHLQSRRSLTLRRDIFA